MALATASVRLMTFILAKMAFTFDFTVPSLINSVNPFLGRLASMTSLGESETAIGNQRFDELSCNDVQ